MLVVDIAVSLGFGDNKLDVGGGASGHDVGAVAADTRGYRVARGVEEVRRDVHRGMALLDGLRGGDDQSAVGVTLRHLGAGREDGRRGR